MAVVDKIRDRYPHAVAFDPAQPRFYGNINKLSAAQISIQSVLKGLFASASGRLTAIQEENIQPAVVIKVQQTDSSTHGFDQVPIGRKPVELPPGETGRGSDIRKYGRSEERRVGKECRSRWS